MRWFFIAQTVLLCIGLPSCMQTESNNKAGESKDTNVSPLEGNWITVSFEQKGKKSNPKRVPQQFKMFHDGFYSLVMYDEQGKFFLAGAGPYETNGNVYEETFSFHSDTSYIGVKIWQKWEVKGDTLYFYGFEKVKMPGGKDLTQEWNANGTFIEKRVRAKK